MNENGRWVNTISSRRRNDISAIILVSNSTKENRGTNIGLHGFLMFSSAGNSWPFTFEIEEPWITYSVTPRPIASAGRALRIQTTLRLTGGANRVHTSICSQKTIAYLCPRSSRHGKLFISSVAHSAHSFRIPTLWWFIARRGNFFSIHTGLPGRDSLRLTPLLRS